MCGRIDLGEGIDRMAEVAGFLASLEPEVSDNRTAFIRFSEKAACYGFFSETTI